MKTNKTLPSFFVIGAGKAGTTAIHEFLRQHPGISLPWRKETHFFVMDREGEPTPHHYGRILNTPIANLDEYLAEFEDKGPNAIRGEVCPTYLAYENAHKNIKKRVPEARLIVILRDPTERFVSSYNFEHNIAVKKGEDVETPTPATFVRDIKAIVDGTASETLQRYIYIGQYYHLLKPYFDSFPLEQILVLFYKDLQNNPNDVMAQITAHIGAEAFTYDTSMRFNPSGKIRFPKLYQLLKGSSFARAIRKRASVKGYQKLRAMAENTFLGKNSILTQESREILISLYIDDIKALEGLLDRDLSGWYKDA